MDALKCDSKKIEIIQNWIYNFYPKISIMWLKIIIVYQSKNTFNFSDAILGELCALESHFPTSSSTSTASSTTSSTGTVLQRVGGSISSNNDHSDQNDHHHPNEEDLLQQQVVPQQQQPIIPPPPPPLMMSSQENIQKYLLSAEPQYITAESVRQNKLMSNSGKCI